MANGKKILEHPLLKNRKNLKNNKMWSFIKAASLYFVIGFSALILLSFFAEGGKKTNDVPLSQIVADIKDQKIKELSLENDEISAKYKGSDKTVTTRKEAGESIYQVLKNSDIDPKSVVIEIKDTSFQSMWVGLLSSVLPLIIIFVVFFFILRQAKDAGQGIFSFGQSRAKMFSKDAPQVKFTDVAGVDEAKKELEEVVDFLKSPQKYKDIGAKIPKGVLLVGPPGTGKTLMAKALAGEAGVPFFSIAGSEFMEMLVGVGAARVRDMFATAKQASPSIIFIDEIESIGRARGFGISGGHDEREQTLNQILVEMDGFTPNDHVIVVGSTNRPDLLDAALVRPGRFDRRVVLNMPDLAGRKAIIEIHMKGKPFTDSVDVERLARRTVGFSGADLANMLNEAAILAARDGKKIIDTIDLEEAATKVKMGPQRKRMQSEDDRKLAAYHEAGHAIVGHNLTQVDPVHRISIVARGMAGGFTMFPPTEDRSNERRSRLLEQITTALGGRAAEELIFKDISTGAASDLEMSTGIARDMVTEYGMSDIGPVNIKPHSMFGIWPGMGEESSGISETMQTKVDTEIKKIVDEAYRIAQAILKKEKLKLDKVAKALLEKETLDTAEFEKIVGKKKSA